MSANPLLSQSRVYDSATRGNPALDELREVFNYRYLIAQLTRRDVTTRYKRSFLGVGWTMLNPLGMMLVLTLAFSHLLRFQTEHSYAGFVLSGLVTWNFFSQTTTAAMVNLVWGGGLLHRIYIPRTSFAIAAILTGLVNFGFAMIPLVIVLLVTGVPLTFNLLLVPIPLLLLTCFALGVGLTISTFAVFYPDIAEMYAIAILGWMYLTPVIYPIAILPESYRFWITRLNPMYYYIELMRMSVYYGKPFPLDLLIPAIVIAVGVLVLGWWIFTSRSDEFAYRV